MSEQWMPLPYAPAYEVSDRGRVRSTLKWRGDSTPRFLAPAPNPDGYLTVKYLSKCYNEGKPHVEDGTDEAGWFQFGEWPNLREWRRFFTDRDHSDPLHFPPQSIRERILHGADTRVTQAAEIVAYRWTRTDGEVFTLDPREVEIVRVLPPAETRDLVRGVWAVAGRWAS